MRTSSLLALLVALSASVACAHVTPVQVDALQPRYAHPESKVVASAPLAVVYDPRELPDDVSLSVPNGFPSSTVHHARSLVTKHLRAALQTMFERVDIVEDPSLAPPGATLATVQFVEMGLTVNQMMVVGTLEWSLSLKRPDESRPFYRWAERTVGSRGGYGSFGRLEAAPLVQGAIEASLRDLLKDLEAHDVAQKLAGSTTSTTRG